MSGKEARSTSLAVAARYRGLKIVILLLTGAIGAYAASAVWLSGSFHPYQLYNVGNVYDMSGDLYETGGENWYYDYAEELVLIGEGGAKHSFEVPANGQKWGYLCLDLDRLSGKTWCEVQFIDGNGDILYALEQELINGRNIWQLQGGTIQGMVLAVKEPCSFQIRRLQLREQLQEHGWAEWLPVFGISFSACLLLLFVFAAVIRKRRTGRGKRRAGIWMEKTEEFYRAVLYRAAGMAGGIPSAKRPQLRSGLFLVCILIVYMMFVTGWRWQALPQRRLVLLLGICLLLIAILSAEVNRRPVNWRNPLMYAWMCLWGMCILSEFIVGKDIQNAGIFMLGCMAPLYMAWSTMRRPEQLLQDFLAALRWSFLAACFFCIFFRPYTPGIRYMGIYMNPNSFGGYLVTANIAFLIWLDENLSREKLKLRILCMNMLALVTICGFLALTQSITSMGVCLAEWIVFIWKQFPNEKTRAYKRQLRRAAAVSAFAAVLVMVPGRWCLEHVPNRLNTTVTFPGDTYTAQANLLTMTVYAGGEVESGTAERALSKLRSGDWDNLFSGRTGIWKTYIRQWNLFGHSGYQVCIGVRKSHAHNALLQTMHYYGVFAAIPYLVMLYYSVKYGILIIFSRRRSGASLFYLMATVNYIVEGIAEDMATPFFYISWLTYFIALGGLVNRPGDGA